ncbi:MAG: DUF4159 domain-containing protein [Planctomycetaceae bacterium]
MTRGDDSHDADDEVYNFPLVIMTGEGEFLLTDAEREDLRQYLSRGGFLLASAGCSSKERDRSFRSEMAELFADSPVDRMSLTPAQIVDAERLLRLMTTADAAAAASMREQLARMEQEVLPLIRDALERAPDDASRARLTAARYRLAASGPLVLAWPGGIERLSSQDFPERIGALDELSKLATSADEGLLLALFSDPAPLIRELALRTLKRISGQAADGVGLGELQSLQDAARSAGLAEAYAINYSYGNTDYSAYQLAAELLPMHADSPTAFGAESGTLKYTVQLTAGFRIVQ